jgi:tRNA (cytidine/uridine-2'-O-)-methyltransferase
LVRISLKVVLVNPLIPPNTGNIARLCAANDIELHIVGKMGFSVDDKHLKRAGLDYWEHVKIFFHDDIDAFFRVHKGRAFFFTKKAEKSIFEQDLIDGDALIFGPEDIGLNDVMLSDKRGVALKIPMLTDNVRSLNLSSAVAIAVYEALRQIKH